MTVQLFLLLVLIVGAESNCPWDESGLVKWSENSTWGGAVPAGGSVVISGKNVLLDISPPPLTSITIDPDAKLIWGNFNNIQIETEFILVNGEFHIGSEDCPFTKNGHILLTGKSNSKTVVEGFGQKFIGVNASATLEIHGAPKTAWTKLIQSVPAAVTTCGVLYNHQDQQFVNEKAFGLHVTIWNPDGSLYDFIVFPLGEADAVEPEEDFKSFVDGVDNGVIVGIAVYGDLGVGLSQTRKWDLVYSAIETLGGIAAGTSQIRKVRKKEAYAFITYTGHPESTKEERVKLLYLHDSTQTSKQKYVHQATSLEFRSRSTVQGTDSSETSNRVDFDVLSTDVSQPIITVRDDVSSWNVGDQIIVTSTDYKMEQVEEFRLLDCRDCTNKQVKLDGDFEYPHYGKISNGVDMRAEVALLTRNILIEGELQEECYDNGNQKEERLCELFKRDTFGGHVIFRRGFTAVHVEGVESYHMGQQLNLGRYPFHYHMVDDVKGSWLRYNSIHNTNNRCMTFHGVDSAEASHNVCYDHPGHGYFLEDSCEQNNIFDGNLGVLTGFGTQLLTDMNKDWCTDELRRSCGDPATFWITHPNNYFRNNVAAGSVGNGFHILYARAPLTLCKERQLIRKLVTEHHARWSKLAQFDGNSAHSNVERGIMFDRLISVGEIDEMSGIYVPENGLLSNNMYDPRDPPEKGAPRTTSYLRRTTLYKNINQNIWTRGGNIVIENSSFADSPVSTALTRSFRATVQEVRRSVFIGESDNLGVPYTYTYNKHASKPKHTFDRSFPILDPFKALVGAEFFFGPVILTDCVFDKFNHLIWNTTWETLYGEKAFRPASAVGFRRNFPYASQPHSGVRQMHLGFCDKVDGIVVYSGDTSHSSFDDPKDGDRQATLRDLDGSITGIPNVQLVKNTPFFMDSDCYYDDVYQMSVCPHWYSKSRFNGDDGVFKDKRRDYPMYMVRNDRIDAPFALEGQKALSYLTMQNRYYTAIFNGTNPTKVNIRVNNLQKDNFIQIGICFPKGTTSFTVTGKNPKINSKNPATPVDDISQLEDDTTGRSYFWDSSTGLFVVRFVGLTPIIGFEECSDDECPEITVERHDGGSEATDCFSDAYGPYKRTAGTASPIVPPTRECVRTSTDGYGAVDPSELAITAPDFKTRCPEENVSDLPTPEYRGCYKTTYVGYLSAAENQMLEKSMTLSLCTGRCYRMGYKYATVAFGNTCRCSNDFNIHGEESTFCLRSCSGKSAELCGGSSSYQVYTTGYVKPEPLVSCGANSAGVVINNRCYIYGDATVTFNQAEKNCRLLGGNLATVPNSVAQEKIEQYLKKYNTDVWFGLNDVATDGDYVYTDGTPVGDFTYFSEGASTMRDFGLLQSKKFYRWTESVATEKHAYLCEVDQTSTPLSTQPCGTSNAGIQLGDSGNCYVVIDTTGTLQESQYRCYRMMGILAPMPDDETKEEIRNHLIRYGSIMDYWVHQPANSRFYAMASSRIFNPIDKSVNSQLGAVCKLDSSIAANGCGTGWKKFGSYCYLYTGVFRSKYTDALDMCTSKLTSLVSIESAEENTDVVQLLKDFDPNIKASVFLGYKYNSDTKKYEWDDGSTSTYTNWRSGHGESKAVFGDECARLITSNLQWRNKDCYSGNSHIVCKAAVVT